MHCPSWVCEAIHRIHPNLRMAWAGRDEARYPGEANRGAFCLVQLISAGRVGPLDNPLIFDELWYVSPRADRWGNAEMQKVDRGPIFNKRGGLSLDYDPITQVPIFIINLEQLGYSNQQVADGVFLAPLKARWLSPAKKRFDDSRKQMLKKAKGDINAMAGEATDFLWREANKSTATSPIVPHEFARADVDAFYKRKEARSLEHGYFK